MSLPYDQAIVVAEAIQYALLPGCTQIRIAGSVRRRAPTCGDIEIVATPDSRPPRPQFGQSKLFKTNLDAILYTLCLDGQEEQRGYLKLRREKGGERYQQYWVSTNAGIDYKIKLDLFTVLPPADWGIIYTLRTGPAEFSHWIVTQRKQGGCLPNGYSVKCGQLWREDGSTISMPDEINFLDFLGLGWISPEKRVARWGHKLPIVNPSQDASLRTCNAPRSPAK